MKNKKSQMSGDEKALAIVGVSAIWGVFACFSGHSELWTVPMFSFSIVLCLDMILCLIRDIYFAKRRERLDEREYWKRKYWEEHKEN